MRDVNKVILVGRLGADPVQRETKAGTAVVHFPLATSRKIPDADTETMKDETQWHQVVAWGKKGESCAQYLKKGNPVYIEGTFRTRKYEGKDGISKYATEVHAEQVNFLGMNRRAEQFEEQALEAKEA